MLPQYTDQFQSIVSKIIILEGGIADHPNDPGGLTNFGISQRSFPYLDIRNLSKEDAEQIYLWHYWLPMKAYLIPQHLRLAVFDFAINAGTSVAIKTLQRLAKVKQDGVMGQGTANAAKSVSVESYLYQRELFYRQLAARKPTSRIFLSGWLIRLKHVRAWVAEMLKFPS